MLNRVKHIFSVLGVLLMLSSCDATIHEYPTDPKIIIDVSCEINDVKPEFFVTVECDTENGTSYIVRTQGANTLGTRFDEPYKLRYTIDLYRVIASHTEFVKRDVITKALNDTEFPTVRYELEAAEYKVLIWCDYVRESAEFEDWYYKTDDLRKILYNDIEVKDNNDKDVFTNMVNLNFRDYSYDRRKYIELDPVHVVLERPKGRYKCITTDIEDYIIKDDVRDITCVASYVQYVAAGYNVEDQKPNYFEPTRTYLSTVSIDDVENGQLEMCYDYVFVNGKQTNVKINFQFYKGIVKMVNGQLFKEGNSPVTDDDRISNWSGIVVPLKRNMETVIEGRFLTASFGSGGLGIDPGFEGEIVIPWE